MMLVPHPNTQQVGQQVLVRASPGPQDYLMAPQQNFAQNDQVFLGQQFKRQKIENSYILVPVQG